MSDQLLVDRRGAVLVITLNRPRAHNALNRAMAEEMAAALDTIDADETLRAGVLTGAAPSFCSGIDLKAFATGEVPDLPGRGLGGLTESPPAKPLIAAVEGYALAGGLELALACDFIVAGEGASFGLPEAQRGQVAAAGGLVRLPRRIPHNVAADLALTGDPIDADRAAAIGLVSRLAPAGEALAVALAAAERIAAAGPLAVTATRRMLGHALELPEADAWQRQHEVNDRILASEDAREGALAFAEKRPPVWKGR